MKLYPAIVTLHLLGGCAGLMLLTAQTQSHAGARLPLPAGPWRASAVVLLLLLVQAALGGWVSTNYAVLACNEFPTCQGSWWPAMDFERGFTLRRDLGRDASGAMLPFQALTAIHMVHRLAAVLVLLAMAALARRLPCPTGRCAASAGRWPPPRCGSWPAVCPTWCWTGPWWRRWRTPVAPAPRSRC